MKKPDKLFMLWFFLPFAGLFFLAKLVPVWSFIGIIVCLVTGGILLDRHLAKRRAHFKIGDDEYLQEKIEAGVGPLVLNDNGILTITVQNKTNTPLRFHIVLALQYINDQGTPQAGAPFVNHAHLATDAHGAKHLLPRTSHCFDLIQERQGTICLTREEHLYHAKLMPFLVEADGLFDLLRAQPDIYMLSCTIFTAGLPVSRTFKLPSVRN